MKQMQQFCVGIGQAGKYERMVLTHQLVCAALLKVLDGIAIRQLVMFDGPISNQLPVLKEAR